MIFTLAAALESDSVVVVLLLTLPMSTEPLFSAGSRVQSAESHVPQVNHPQTMLRSPSTSVLLICQNSNSAVTLTASSGIVLAVSHSNSR